MKCTTESCGRDVSTVGEVRGCRLCQQNGTAAAVHAHYLNEEPIENVVRDANPGAFPFEAEPPAVKAVEHEDKIKRHPLDHDGDGKKGGSLPRGKRGR